MSKLTIYHNPRCSKSRQTLSLIEAAGITPEIKLYLDTPPSVTELDDVLQALGMPPEAIVRKGEDAYKELGLATKTLTRQEWLQTLHDHPKLIERPIVVKGKKAVLGRPPENVQALL